VTLLRRKAIALKEGSETLSPQHQG
jgi:hypothetical protein